MTLPGSAHSRNPFTLQKPTITIRLGAAHNDVSVDGHTFDRTGMSRYQRHFLDNKLIDGLIHTGALPSDNRSERKARWKFKRRSKRRSFTGEANAA